MKKNKSKIFYLLLIFLFCFFLLSSVFYFFTIHFSVSDKRNSFSDQNTKMAEKTRNDQFEEIYDNSGIFFTKGNDENIINNSGKEDYIGHQQNINFGTLYQNQFFLNLQSDSIKRINNNFTDNLVVENEYGYVSGAPSFVQLDVSTSNYKNDYKANYNITFNFPCKIPEIGINTPSIGFKNMKAGISPNSFNNYQITPTDKTHGNITQAEVLNEMNYNLGDFFNQSENGAITGGTNPNKDGTSIFKFVIVKKNPYVYFYICAQDNKYRRTHSNLEMERILFFRSDIKTLKEIFNKKITGNHYMPTTLDNPISDLTVNMVKAYKPLSYPLPTTIPTPNFAKYLMNTQIEKAWNDNVGNLLSFKNIYAFGGGMSSQLPFNKKRYLEKPLTASTTKNDYWINGGDKQEGGRNVMIDFNGIDKTSSKLNFIFKERYITRLFSTYGGEVKSKLNDNVSVDPSSTSLSLTEIPMFFVSDFGYGVDGGNNQFGNININDKNSNFIFAYPLNDPNITLSDSNGNPYSYSKKINYFLFYIPIIIFGSIMIIGVSYFFIFFIFKKKRKKR